MSRALATSAPARLSWSAAVGAGVMVSLAIPTTDRGLDVELVTLRVRLAVSSPGPVDVRIVLIDGGRAVDGEQLADVVEIARGHGARAQGFLTEPSAPNERLSAAVAECGCVVVDHEHVLAPFAEVVADAAVDVSGPVPRVAFASGPRTPFAFALAVARVAGAPAQVEGRAAAFVRPRAVAVLSLDDVLIPRVDLDATFRGALVMVGPPELLQVHASVLDDLVRGRLLAPPTLASTVGLGALLAVLGALAGSRRRLGLRAVLLVLVPAVEGASAAAAFAVDVWLPLAGPTLSFGTAFVVAFASQRARGPACGSSVDQR